MEVISEISLYYLIFCLLTEFLICMDYKKPMNKIELLKCYLKGSPRTNMNWRCDWLIKAIKDNKTIEM